MRYLESDKKMRITGYVFVSSCTNYRQSVHVQTGYTSYSEPLKTPPCVQSKTELLLQSVSMKARRDMGWPVLKHEMACITTQRTELPLSMRVFGIHISDVRDGI